MSKIIDFKRKGNAILFYLGADDDVLYRGDDWGDYPYEHNAGPVYSEFITGYAEIYVDIDLNVLTPDEDWFFKGNSPYCKNDFKDRVAPCLIVSITQNQYVYALGKENNYPFYFGDKLKPGKYFLTSHLEREEFYGNFKNVFTLGSIL